MFVFFCNLKAKCYKSTHNNNLSGKTSTFNTMFYIN